MKYKELISELSKLSKEQLDQEVYTSEGSMPINTIRIVNGNVYLSEKGTQRIVYVEK